MMDARVSIPDSLPGPQGSAKPREMEDFPLEPFSFMWFEIQKHEK